MPKNEAMETPDGGDTEKKKMDTLIRAVAAANEGKVYTHKDDKWQVMFDELKTYKEENGNCNVPWRYKSEGLGMWVVQQRGAYKEKSLSQDRVEQLSSIGFDWNPRENKWADMYQQLKAYKEEHGHCNVSNRLHPYKALGAFVNVQRRFYKEQRMPKERIKLLEDLGFCWNIKNEYWDDMYRQLKEYKEQHGDLNLPTTNPLYSWMNSQRRKNRNSQLSGERKNLLDALGIDWGVVNKKEQWQTMYEELKEFKDANGHANVPDGYSLNVPLDRWVQHQRKTYKDGKLSDERKGLLLEIGFMFEPQNDKWSMMYQKLLQYKEEHGNCDVSKNYKPDGLGSWVKANRRAFKNKKLVQDRIDRLNAAGFSFTMKGKKIEKVFPNRSKIGFDGWFQKLVEYKEQHGDCRVPKAWEPDVPLANWVRNTRQQRKKGLLSQELIDRLDEIGMAWAPGMGNYKRTPKNHAPPALDEQNHDSIDYGIASPSHPFEEAPPDESNEAHRHDQHNVAYANEAHHDDQHNMAYANEAHHHDQNNLAYAPYQMALNQTIQENERLAEINRQQAEEIARLRAELNSTNRVSQMGRGW